MDSQVTVDGALLSIIDASWRDDNLAFEEIAVPVYELPDPEPDSTTPNLTLRQLENKWSELMLSRVLETQASNN